MKKDNSEFIWSEEMLEPIQFDRRDFLKLSGGGLFILFRFHKVRIFGEYIRLNYLKERMSNIY